MKNRHSNAPLLIQSTDHWSEVHRDLFDQEFVALDTEFMRVNTYFPRLCLLQVATPAGVIACVDPLVVENSVMAEALKHADGCFILHSAGQDLEVLHTDLGFRPERLFDTQLAAAFLGEDDQIGYARLVEELCGHSLPKSHTRTDWCKRPLSSGQLEYAAADVEFLCEIQAQQQEALGKDEKLAWFLEELENRFFKVSRDTEAESIARFRGGAELNESDQALLAELIVWREKTAKKQNRPREWVIGNRDLVTIAQKHPEQKHQFRTYTDLNEAQISKYADAVMEIVSDRDQLTPKTYWKSSLPLSDSEKKEYKRLRNLLQRIAKDLAISATLLGNRKDIEALIRGKESRLQQGWRGVLTNGNL